MPALAPVITTTRVCMRAVYARASTKRHASCYNRAMPFTFFAHQVFVVPLKVWKPNWFDGTALCIGSMAPDFAYALYGTRLAFASHTLLAQWTWTLPVTVAATFCLRRCVAQPLGSQLPEPLSSEVRALARSRPAFAVTAASAVLGGLSHIFVDAFTHPHGWAFDRFALLRREFMPGVTLAEMLQAVGHSFGTLLGLWLFAWIVRERCISRWNRTGAGTGREHASEPWFWPFLAGGALLAVPAAYSAAISGGGLPVAIIRAACILAMVLMVATLRVRRSLAAQRVSRP
jgi:hypothetical protein